LEFVYRSPRDTNQYIGEDIDEHLSIFTRKKLKLYSLNIYFLNIVDIKYTSLDILDMQK